MLQQLALPRAERLQTCQRFMQIVNRFQALIRHPESLLQLERAPTSAAFCCRSGTGTVYQQVPHDLRGEREEVGPIREVHMRSVYQTKVRFVNQRRRVQRLLDSCVPQPPVRQPAEPVVDQRNELIAGEQVPRTPTL